jgi:hypothetical protein
MEKTIDLNLAILHMLQWRLRFLPGTIRLTVFLAMLSTTLSNPQSWRLSGKRVYTFVK